MMEGITDTDTSINSHTDTYTESRWSSIPIPEEYQEIGKISYRCHLFYQYQDLMNTDTDTRIWNNTDTDTEILYWNQ